VPDKERPLEQAHAQPALGAGDRRRSTRRPAAGDDYVGIELSRCHVPAAIQNDDPAVAVMAAGAGVYAARVRSGVARIKSRTASK